MQVPKLMGQGQVSRGVSVIYWLTAPAFTYSCSSKPYIFCSDSIFMHLLQYHASYNEESRPLFYSYSTIISQSICQPTNKLKIRILSQTSGAQWTRTSNLWITVLRCAFPTVIRWLICRVGFKLLLILQSAK